MSASLVNVEFLYSDLKRETRIEGMTDVKFSERGAELAQKQCSQAAVLCVWVHRIAVLRAAPLRQEGAAPALVPHLNIGLLLLQGFKPRQMSAAEAAAGDEARICSMR